MISHCILTMKHQKYNTYYCFWDFIRTCITWKSSKMHRLRMYVLRKIECILQNVGLEIAFLVKTCISLHCLAIWFKTNLLTAKNALSCVVIFYCNPSERSFTWFVVFYYFWTLNDLKFECVSWLQYNFINFNRQLLVNTKKPHWVIQAQRGFFK